MKLNRGLIGFFVVLLFSITYLSGCAVTRGANRFYTGPPLPKNDIALVYAAAGCKMRDVKSEAEQERRYLDFMNEAPSLMLDLLPGDYLIGVTFSHSSSSMNQRSQTLGNKIRVKLHAQPGNIYIIYPLFEGNNWQPVAVNIDDYEKKKCESHNKIKSCPSKEKISKKIAEYLHDERPVMKFHPLSETPYYKPVTEEAKREIKGFWW